jgi:hypothetical protein
MFSFRRILFQNPCFAARFSWAAPLLVGALAGCGGGPALVEVNGTLTHKGKPVANAVVHFSPENGRPSSGITDEEGHFTLKYDAGHEGTLIGKHIVSVKARPTTVKQQEAVMMGKKMPMSKDMADFFDKYGPANSKYEVKIDKNTQELKLDLD